MFILVKNKLLFQLVSAVLLIFILNTRARAEAYSEPNLLKELLSRLSPAGQEKFREEIKDVEPFDSEKWEKKFEEEHKQTDDIYTEELKEKYKAEAETIFVPINKGDKITIPVRRGRGYVDYTGTFHGFLGGSDKQDNFAKILVGSKRILLMDLPPEIQDRFDPSKIKKAQMDYLNRKFYHPKNRYMTEYAKKKNDYLAQKKRSYIVERRGDIEKAFEKVAARYPALDEKKLEESLALPEEDKDKRGEILKLLRERYYKQEPIYTTQDKTLLLTLYDIAREHEEYAVVNDKLTMQKFKDILRLSAPIDENFKKYGKPATQEGWESIDLRELNRVFEKYLANRESGSLFNLIVTDMSPAKPGTHLEKFTGDKYTVCRILLNASMDEEKYSKWSIGMLNGMSKTGVPLVASYRELPVGSADNPAPSAGESGVIDVSAQAQKYENKYNMALYVPILKKYYVIALSKEYYMHLVHAFLPRYDVNFVYKDENGKEICSNTRTLFFSNVFLDKNSSGDNSCLVVSNKLLPSSVKDDVRIRSADDTFLQSIIGGDKPVGIPSRENIGEFAGQLKLEILETVPLGDSSNIRVNVKVTRQSYEESLQDKSIAEKAAAESGDKDSLLIK